MTNRDKGKRGERYFATKLKPIFPKIKRNAGEQSQGGGVDLLNVDPFNIECKFGKRYQSKMIRSLLDQVKKEGKQQSLDLVLVKPEREQPYALMPLGDFLEILEMLHTEKII